MKIYENSWSAWWPSLEKHNSTILMSLPLSLSLSLAFFVQCFEMFWVQTGECRPAEGSIFWASSPRLDVLDMSQRFQHCHVSTPLRHVRFPLDLTSVMARKLKAWNHLPFLFQHRFSSCMETAKPICRAFAWIGCGRSDHSSPSCWSKHSRVDDMWFSAKKQLGIYTIPNRGSFLGNKKTLSMEWWPQSWPPVMGGENGMVTMALGDYHLSESQPPIQAGKSYLIGAPRSARDGRNISSASRKWYAAHIDTASSVVVFTLVWSQWCGSVMQRTLSLSSPLIVFRKSNEAMENPPFRDDIPIKSPFIGNFPLPRLITRR